MKTLALINLKGGTGKTVSAANMAHILATVHRKHVLLVDADKQGNASRYFSLYGEQDGTAALLWKDPLDIAEIIYPTQYKGLDVITSNMDLYTTDRELYEDSADVSGVLAAALARVRDDYDFCIIDNGPAVDMVTLNVLAAADDVLIPIRPDEFSFSGLLDLVEQVQAVQEKAAAECWGKRGPVTLEDVRKWKEDAAPPSPPPASSTGITMVTADETGPEPTPEQMQEIMERAKERGTGGAVVLPAKLEDEAGVPPVNWTAPPSPAPVPPAEDAPEPQKKAMSARRAALILEDLQMYCEEMMAVEGERAETWAERDDALFVALSILLKRG